jgi:hypothetical protein
VAKEYLADRDRHHVSREYRSRAAQILLALAEEAPRRGLTVAEPAAAAPAADGYPRATSPWHLVLGSPAGDYGIRIQEVSAPGGQPLYLRPWRERRTRPAWLDARRQEFVSTGVLELLVDGPGMVYGGGTRFRDATTVPLEEKLSRVFQKIEIHRLDDEWRAEERRRADEERRRRWEVAMAEARARYDEQARWEDFRKRSLEWEEVGRLRAFFAAARALPADEPGHEDVVAHLDLMERRLDAIDPLGHAEGIVPTVVDPKPEDLKPFLDGWSPNGPDWVGWFGS